MSSEESKTNRKGVVSVFERSQESLAVLTCQGSDIFDAAGSSARVVAEVAIQKRQNTDRRVQKGDVYLRSVHS